ncbi:2477_t:CDS:2, partial [Racocetra fulgida]
NGEPPLEIEKVDRAIDNMAGVRCGVRLNSNQCLASLFPGSVVTSSKDGNFHIVWSNSIRNISTSIQLFNFIIIGRTNRFFEKQLKDLFKNINDLLIELEQTIGKIINALDENRYEQLN